MTAKATILMRDVGAGPVPCALFHDSSDADVYIRDLRDSGFAFEFGWRVWVGNFENVARLIVEEGRRRHTERTGVELSVEAKAAMKAAWTTLPDDLRSALLVPGRRVSTSRTDAEILADRDKFYDAVAAYEVRERLVADRAKEVVAYMRTRKAESALVFARYGGSQLSAIPAVKHIVEADRSVFVGEMELRMAMRFAEKGEARMTNIEHGLAWSLALQHRHLVPRDGGKFWRFWKRVVEQEKEIA